MKKSSSSSSLPRQQQQQQQQRQRQRRNRSRSSSNHRHGNNKKSTGGIMNDNTRGHSPRPNNKSAANHSRKPSHHRSRSSSNTHTRRTTTTDTTTNNDHDKYRFSKTLHGSMMQQRKQSRSTSRSKKFHMPHIIPNISPSALLKKHSNNNSHDNDDGGGGGGRRRGRSSTPKGYTTVEERENDRYNRRSSSSGVVVGGNSSKGMRRSRSSNYATSRNNTTAATTTTFGLRSRRSRSASFQSSQQRQQQQYDDHHFIGSRRTRSTSGRRRDNHNNNFHSSTKSSSSLWRRAMNSTSDHHHHQRGGGDDDRHKRRRGKSMPARFFHSMSSNFGFHKKNSSNNNTTYNQKQEEREDKKTKLKNDLETSFPDLNKEMKRISSKSRERGGGVGWKSSDNNNKQHKSDEWGTKPRGRSRPRHTRSRSDNNHNHNASNNPMKDLEAEMANIVKAPPPGGGGLDLSNNNPPPPPPPPRPLPPPPPYNNNKNNNNSKNYQRSKSLPKNFQRYTLLDVMVEMEKEIEVPLNYNRKPSDSVISPIASMDSSWRYKEDMLLMKTMASLSAMQQQQQGGRGRGRGREGYDPMKRHGSMSRIQQQQQHQPPPPPVKQAVPTTPVKHASTVFPPPFTAKKVKDINDIDGDDDEEEEEVLEEEENENVNQDETNRRDSIHVRDSISIPSTKEPTMIISSLQDEDSDDDDSDDDDSDDDDDVDNSEGNDNGKSSSAESESKEEQTQISESIQTNDSFTFGSSSRLRPSEPISSVYGSSAIESSPEGPTYHRAGNAMAKKKKEPPSHDSSPSTSGGGSGSSSSSSSSSGEGDSLIGYASVASDEKVGSIAPPPHSSIRKKKPGAIPAVGLTPLSSGDRSAAGHSLGTLSRMHNELQRKMSALQEGLDEHGRPVKEFDVNSMDSSLGVSDVTLPTVLMKAPPISSRIRAMKPKPLTTRRTKNGTLELEGDIEAMKSLAVSELTMASPVQSAYPKSMRMYSYKKTVTNTSAPPSAPPPPRRASAPVRSTSRRNTTQPKPAGGIAPVVESSEEHQHADSFGKNSSTRSLHSRQSSVSKLSLGTTSMPMKPASGAGHRHVPPPPKHRPPGTKIDIGEVAQQLQAMQGHNSTAANSIASSRGGRKYTLKGSGGSYSSSVKHSHVEGMKWSDKFGKSGRYTGDVNADYVPHGVGSMHYDFGLAVEGRWVDGTLLSNDLDDGSFVV